MFIEIYNSKSGSNAKKFLSKRRVLEGYVRFYGTTQDEFVAIFALTEQGLYAPVPSAVADYYTALHIA